MDFGLIKAGDVYDFEDGKKKIIIYGVNDSEVFWSDSPYGLGEVNTENKAEFLQELRDNWVFSKNK